jgi:hypothetical protein
MKTADKFSSLSAGTGCRLPRRAVLTGVALLAGAFGWQATTARANEVAVLVPPLIDFGARPAAPAPGTIMSDTAVLAGGSRVRHQIPFSPVFDPTNLTKSST